MTPLLQSVLAVGAVSLVSLVGLATLSMRPQFLKGIIFILISLAAGALLGDAFLHLIPEAYETTGNAAAVSLCILAGILTFFVLEKFLQWHHSHGEEEFSPDHGRIHPVGKLVLVSDGIHNLIDGLAIGVAFMVSTEVGIATTVAIALHELPQEVGDFGLLVHAGLSRWRALLLNFLSALLAFVGLALASWFGETNQALVPFIAAFAAGNFIYIALTDIVPEIQKTKSAGRSIIQIVVVILGISAMLGLLGTETHHHHDEDVLHDSVHTEHSESAAHTKEH